MTINPTRINLHFKSQQTKYQDRVKLPSPYDMLSRPPLIVLVRRTSPRPKIVDAIAYQTLASIVPLHALDVNDTVTKRGARLRLRAGIARGSGSTRHPSQYRHLSHERCHCHYLNSSKPMHRHQTRLRRYSIFTAYQDNPVKSRCNRRRKQRHGGRHFDVNSS